MIKNCQQCDSRFEITDEDLKYYDQISPVFDGCKFAIPVPKMCPLCRQQRRLAFRNERKLYSRKCDMSGRQILSIYSPDKPYKVYDQPEWWSDKWDALIYGRDFDSSKSFSEQFKDLYAAVPRASLHTINVENSYYTCYSLFCKNCYLLFGGGNNEDVMFAKYVAFNKNLIDGLCVYSSEFCYEAIASDGCYNCKFILNCRNCSDSLMIEDCIACRNCIGCFGLRNKEYCVFNQFPGREKYEIFAKDYEYLTHAKLKFLRNKLKEVSAKLPHVQSHIYASENCTGDAVFNSKNCHFAYDVKDSENCKFLHNSPKCIGTYDSVYCAPTGLQFCYNMCSCVGTNLMVGYFVWYCDNVRYSFDCVNSRDLFGCVGLKSRQYCVFNKQYTREEYEKLVARIIEHMQKTGEWGEFFSYSLAPIGYNESVAIEYFPLSQEQSEKLGAFWYEEQIVKRPDKDFYDPPDDIRDVGDEIFGRILECEVSGREYKIVPAELKFYKQMKLPIPRRHPDQRHYDRLKLHDVHRLWERKCDKCGKKIMSVYEPKRPEIVHCSDCYLMLFV